MVSLGTGKPPIQALKQPLDISMPDSIFGAAQAAMNASTFLEFLVDTVSGMLKMRMMMMMNLQCTQADQRVVDRARAWCRSIRVPYYRLTPQLSEAVGLDEQDDRKLAGALWETMIYVRQKRESFEQLREVLDLV